MSTPPMVVGVDGGPGSAATLTFALQEAALRETKVLAIFCWPTSGSRDDSSPRCVTQEDAADILARAVSEVTRHESRHVPIVREVRQGFAGPTLVAAARTSDLLVIGSTHHGAGIRHRGHHTIDYCLTYASVPVLVVPATAVRHDELDIQTEINLHQSELSR